MDSVAREHRDVAQLGEQVGLHRRVDRLRRIEALLPRTLEEPRHVRVVAAADRVGEPLVALLRGGIDLVRRPLPDDLLALALFLSTTA